MQQFKKTGILLTSLLICIVAMAQNDSTNNSSGDVMRSSGKLYVVLAVVLTIIAGLVFYVVRLDRKISRLEKEKGTL